MLMFAPDVIQLRKIACATRTLVMFLPTLTFALDYWRAGGADPRAFKTTNIVLHVLTTCALAWFFRSLLLLTGVTPQKANWLAPALALAWAAHDVGVHGPGK